MNQAAPETSLRLGWLRRHLTRLHRSEQGSISIEAMFMIPLMVWALLGSYVFYDAYRSQFVNAKAGYTIGDILSRETGYITPEYLDSLHDLQQFLVNRRDPIRLRVTVISYDLASDTFSVRWSQNRGGGGTLDDNDLTGMASVIPDMANGSIAIIVQTSMIYEPIFGAGLKDELLFDDLVITRPRFANQLCWNSSNANPTQDTATC